MEELIGRIDELAALMDEFGLTEAQLSGSDWKVGFKRAFKAAPEVSEELEEVPPASVFLAPAPPAETKPPGTPVNSPMNGIFYSSPSPSAPPFVRPGEAVTAGQVVGLIEAMKVFNEIVAPISGTVEQIVADNGQLVQPGDPLLILS